jgi:peroxiredoxin
MLRRITLFLCLLTTVEAAVPRPLANVPIQTPDLKKINLRQYRGKVLALIFFSTTCEPCTKTINVFDRLQKELGPRGFQTIAAAVNSNASYLVTPYTQRYRPSFPIGFLEEDATMKLADFDRDTHPFVPIVMFVDRQGTVRVQYFGKDPVFKDAEKSFRGIVESLLKIPAQAKKSAVSNKH